MKFSATAVAVLASAAAVSAVHDNRRHVLEKVAEKRQAFMNRQLGYDYYYDKQVLKFLEHVCEAKSEGKKGDGDEGKKGDGDDGEGKKGGKKDDDDDGEDDYDYDYYGGRKTKRRNRRNLAQPRGEYYDEYDYEDDHDDDDGEGKKADGDEGKKGGRSRGSCDSCYEFVIFYDNERADYVKGQEAPLTPGAGTVPGARRNLARSLQKENGYYYPEVDEIYYSGEVYDACDLLGHPPSYYYYRNRRDLKDVPKEEGRELGYYYPEPIGSSQANVYEWCPYYGYGSHHFEENGSNAAPTGLDAETQGLDAETLSFNGTNANATEGRGYYDYCQYRYMNFYDVTIGNPFGYKSAPIKIAAVDVGNEQEFDHIDELFYELETECKEWPFLVPTPGGFTYTDNIYGETPYEFDEGVSISVGYVGYYQIWYNIVCDEFKPECVAEDLQPYYDFFLTGELGELCDDDHYY